MNCMSNEVCHAHSATRPTVSVAMVTYNHEPFIRQAIEGVLMQETAFPIELVIGEDCSTDGTREIVKSYALARPGAVNPILHARNVGGQRNVESVLEKCRGRYIAYLEGDDYWTSPHKLQTQVDFLDRNPDHSLCGHRVLNIPHDGREWASYPSDVQRESGTLEDILRWNYLPSCSVLYRAGLLANLPSHLELSDWLIWAHLATQGKVGFRNEVMAHYRVHAGGIWSGASVSERLHRLERTINVVHDATGDRYPALRLNGLLMARLAAASQHNRLSQFREARRCLRRALLANPAGFLASADARACVEAQLMFYALDPLTRRLDAVRHTYHRARIRVGAARRDLWATMLRSRPKANDTRSL